MRRMVLCKLQWFLLLLPSIPSLNPRQVLIQVLSRPLPCSLSHPQNPPAEYHRLGA
ncbi:hypothetical protein Hanom_Chr06g00544251 [Helianthus anomalus]